MKKFICLLLSIALLSSILSGCKNKTEEYIESTAEPSEETTMAEPSVWDGSIATAFAGGDGSENDPYQISTSEELAFLAQQVNSGNSYTGMHIELTNDIDLNNLEWTPIGNGKYFFEGYLDGKDHSITNLKITTAFKYTHIDTSVDIISTWGFAGLFGVCKNANLYNLNINFASISVENTDEYNQLFIGALVGRIIAADNSKINNISIESSNISTDNLKSSVTVTGTSSIYVGGLAGYVLIDSTSTYNIGKIQTNTSINCQEKYTSNNVIGGIVGFVNNFSDFACCNFISYLTTESPTYPMGNFYCGAFGYISNDSGHIDLSNGFSKIDINNKTLNVSGDRHIHRWNTIVGYANQINTVSAEICNYSFQNLFGFVNETTDITSRQIYDLYVLSDNIMSFENNCKGCQELPPNHGFDENIWNVDDLSSPKLR